MGTAICRQGGPAAEGGQGHRWFIVANGSRARAYVQRVGAPGYDVVREWDEPDARAHDRDLGEDRPGRLFAAAGAAGRSAIERDAKDDSPKEHARRDLMHAIAQDIAAALRGREATGVVLVAPTTMLRALKAAVPHDLQPAIVGEHGADLTQLPTAEVFERLDALRRGGGPPSAAGGRLVPALKPGRILATLGAWETRNDGPPGRSST